MAKNLIFPKKTFLIENKFKKYTPILHFFNSTRVFNSKPTANVVFTCKERNCRLESSLGDFSNINKHFITKVNDHPISSEWYSLYKKKSIRKEKLISDDTLNLMKYFISSDTALLQFENEFLNLVLKPEIQLFSVWTFRYKILPAVMNKMMSIIESKLNSAEFITLVVNGWTALFSNIEYQALYAQTINSLWETESMCIGMVPMEKGHSADALQEAIEKMVNKFKINDLTKIIGISKIYYIIFFILFYIYLYIYIF